jgi:hypothetical protein
MPWSALLPNIGQFGIRLAIIAIIGIKFSLKPSSIQEGIIKF